MKRERKEDKKDVMHGLMGRVLSGVMAIIMLLSGCPDAWSMAGSSLQEPTGSEASGSGSNQPENRLAGAGNRPVSRPSHTKKSGNAATASPTAPALPDSIGLSEPLTGGAAVVEDEIKEVNGKIEVEPIDTVDIDLNRRKLMEEFPEYAAADTLTAGEAWLADSLATAPAPEKPDEWVPREVEFSPNPTRAVWMSALFPGLGQVYNRRYWKLPIIVGGYLGLAYATNWNNNMLTDYTKAYADLLDNDPDTKSYMNLFAPNVQEESLDKSWLQSVIQSRKNYFRRNRDLCIICMVGVYLIAMVDAYVDASLSHFDISPDLSVDLSPAVMQDGRQRYPSVGLMWALNF